MEWGMELMEWSKDDSDHQNATFQAPGGDTERIVPEMNGNLSEGGIDGFLQHSSAIGTGNGAIKQ